MGLFSKNEKGKHAPGNPEAASGYTPAGEPASAGAPSTDYIAANTSASYASADAFASGAGGPFIPDAPRKNRSGLKAFLITFFVLAAVIAAMYVGIAVMFSNQFMPNTRVGHLDISMKHDDEVAELLWGIPADYQLEVAGNDFSLNLTGEDVGMSLDVDALIKAMHDDQNPWYWPWYVTETNHDETYLLKTTFNEETCDKLVKEAVDKFNKDATAPVDASIVFDEISNTFSVKQEQIGTQLDVEKVQEVVRAAAKDMLEKAEVGNDQLKLPKLFSTDQKLIDSVDMANGLVSAHLTLSINGNTVDEIGSDVLSGFIQISDDFDVTLSEDEMAAWVENLAASYDTVGTERTYTRADGKVITVRGGAYGWEVDKETLRTQILDAIRAGETMQIDIPCIDSANMFARRGDRDWGNRYIDVDITEQHVRFYGDDGKIIWEADCISGIPDGNHDTVQGVWYVIMKESPSKLVGYTKEGKKDYEVEVKYWMPFEGNSIGFHDADWQPSFGGQMYAQGYGSHGCVNLSPKDAKSLYKIIEPGDVVVVHS